MIYPPDELLADLQSAIPEPQDGRKSGQSGTSSGKGQYDDLPALPGAEGREVFDVPPGYDPVAMTPPPGDQVSQRYVCNGASLY